MMRLGRRGARWVGGWLHRSNAFVSPLPPFTALAASRLPSRSQQCRLSALLGLALSFSLLPAKPSSSWLLSASPSPSSFSPPPSTPPAPSVSFGRPDSVPLVDLSAPEPVVVMQLRQACLQHGFFYLRLAPDQPDFQALRQAAIEQSRAFFALPMETKLETVVDENTRGFAPSLQDINETTRVALADRTRLGRWKESFFLGRDIPPTSPEAKDFMQGPNQWPDPCRLPFFRPTLESYFQLCHELGERLNELLALSLGLDRHFFLQEGYFDKPMLLMRLLHYQVPASAAGNGELVEVAAAHTDYGMVTILANDQEPGLQVWINGEWTNLPPIPGTLVVNLGDMLQKWSGDLYKSTRHRVMVHPPRACEGRQPPKQVDRFAIAFFFEPNVDCLVQRLPLPHMQHATIVTDVTKQKQQLGSTESSLQPVRSGDHLRRKAQADIDD